MGAAPSLLHCNTPLAASQLLVTGCMRLPWLFQVIASGLLPSLVTADSFSGFP